MVFRSTYQLCWGILLLCVMGAGPVFAQQEMRFSIVLRGAPLEQALEELIATTQIDLIYDSDLVRDVRVYCSQRRAPVEALLHCILQEADLDFYRLSSGTYVLIASPEDAPHYGSIAGIVVDKETGDPLPYAHVFLADASIGTAANEAGMFSLLGLLPGPTALAASYLGYEVSTDSVWVPAGGRLRHQIALQARTIYVEPVIISGLQQRILSDELGAGTRGPADLSAQSGQGTADVVRSVQNMVGVGLRAPIADLHIQGGESGEHQMLLDGVPVFDPVSLGRILGAFSPLAIGRLTIHKAGYGVEHGSQLSGAVAVEHGLVDRKGHAVTIEADPLSANARVNYGFDLPRGGESLMMVAGRTSIWDVYQSGSLENLLRDWNIMDPILTSIVLGAPFQGLRFQPKRRGSDIGFSDFHAAWQFRFNPFHKLHTSFYRGRNDIATELLTAKTQQSAFEVPLVMLTRDQYHWTNIIWQARYEWLLGARTLGTTRLRGSRHTLWHGYRFIDNQTARLDEELSLVEMDQGLIAYLDALDIDKDRNRISEVALESSLDYSLNDRHHIQVGLEVAHVVNRFHLDSPFFRFLSFDFKGWRWTGYMQERYQINRNWSTELGTRLTYIPDRNSVYAEPRFSIRYDGSNGPLGPYAVRVAAGLYRQYINQFELSSVGPSAAVPSIRFWLPTDHTRAPPRAHHLAADLVFTPEANWKINLETYYKGQPHLLALDYRALLNYSADRIGPLPQSDFVSRIRGAAYGGGIGIEQINRLGRLIANYSYSRAYRSYPAWFDGREVELPWNQPHRLFVSTDLFLNDALTARVRAQGIWNRSWGFRRAYYDYLAAHLSSEELDPFDLDTPSDDELPALYQLDIGLTYEPGLGWADLQLRVDILNLLNRPNVVDWSLSQGEAPDAPFELLERILPQRTVALSARLGF